MHCSEPGGSVAVADGTTDQLHHFVDAIIASRAQMELKLNCTAQRMLGRCRLRLETTTAQGAWVVRPPNPAYVMHTAQHLRIPDLDWEADKAAQLAEFGRPFDLRALQKCGLRWSFHLAESC